MTTFRFRTTSSAMAVAAIVAIGVPAVAQVPTPGPAPTAAEKRRYDMKVLEGALVGAVRHGAEVLGGQLKPYNPNLVLLTGTARARGFLLEGYGAFFDVEIPALRESVAWSIRTMAMEPNPYIAQWLTNLRRQVASIPDAAVRASFERSIAQLDRQLQPMEGPGTRARPQQPDARRVTSAAVAQDESAPEIAPVPQPEPAAAPDPNALYTETVKNALIDAMLDYSGPLGIGPDEWLTVAARDAEGPLSPGEPYDAVTIVLRIKGSDLAAFRADRISRQEARTRVLVREI